jgi:aminoglycoside 6-adenylyltransferase
MPPSLSSRMDELERRLVEWANKRQDVRALIVVGSRARQDHPADEWADLDVALATTDAKRYHRDTSWIAEIAPIWAVHKDPSGVTYHILFAGGLDAGIAIIPIAPVRLATRVVPLMQRWPSVTRALPFGKAIGRQLDEAGEYYRRGYRVLLDRDGTAEKFLSLFPAGEAPSNKLPKQRDFRAAVDEFWFVVVWTAKHIWRGDLWHARSTGSEGRLRALLLQMIEWHARATHGAAYETWEGGRFIEEWADPRVLAALPDALPPYDRRRMEQGLLEMAHLFAWLSEETAKMLRLEYTSRLADDVVAWIGENSPG